MTLPDVAGPAVPVRVPPEVYRGAVRYVEGVGRELRMDPPDTQGVSTEWFTQSAFSDGALEDAHGFVDYERAEYHVIYRSVLTGWLSDVLEHVATAPWSPSGMDRVLRTPGGRLWEDLDVLGGLAADALHHAIDARDAPGFEIAQTMLREAHLRANDVCVHWIQDLFTTVAQHEGEDAVEKLMRVSYERIWRHRYSAWFALGGHERLALSSEGMRAHYAGPGRRGDFQIEPIEGGWVMAFDPCGTGGVLRRENALLGGRWFDETTGVNTEPAPWSWGLTGVPWYCAHCPMLLEQFPLQTHGRIVRPVAYDPDPWGKTRWVVYSDAGPDGAPGPQRA